VTGEAVHLFLEHGDVLKFAVDAGEADIGNMVGLFQPGHDQVADSVAMYLRPAHLVKLDFNIVNETVGGAGGEGSFFTGLTDARQELFAVELLAAAVLFNDEKARPLQTLVGGEAQIALQTLAPAADAVVNVTGVDNLRIVIAAERTIHATSPQTVVSRLINYHNRLCLSIVYQVGL